MPSLVPYGLQANGGHGRGMSVIAGRYRVLEEAGCGNFAQVVKAVDTKNNDVVAVKILKREYQRDAEAEYEVLESIGRNDPNNDVKVCKMLSHFDWDGQPCFVFTLLGPNLKSRRFGSPVTDKEVVQLARELARTLNYFHFTCKLIHTDLKPENILLDEVDVAPTGLGSGWSICDLGSASFFSSKPDQDLIQTQPYRAPEVILGCPWSYAVDMWSLACILYEVKTGQQLFRARNDEQHLQMMEKRLGSIPKWLVESAAPRVRRSYFDHQDRLVHTPSVFSNPGPVTPLKEELQDEPDLLDFLLQCLEWDPAVRMRADEALHHPFITKYFTPDDTDSLLSRLPSSGYTSGAIRTPGTGYLQNQGAPLTKSVKEKLRAEQAKTTTSPRLAPTEQEVMRYPSSLPFKDYSSVPKHQLPPAGMPSRPRTHLMAPPRPSPLPPDTVAQAEDTLRYAREIYRNKEQSSDRYVTSSSAYGSSARHTPSTTPRFPPSEGYHYNREKLLTPSPSTIGGSRS